MPKVSKDVRRELDDDAGEGRHEADGNRSDGEDSSL